MSNEKISDIFKLLGQLLELHEANPFKIKAYTSAIYQIDKLAETLNEKTSHEIERMGFSNNIANKIIELCQTQTLPELDELLAKTPNTLLEILKIKGLGAKKVQVLWKELQIETIEQLAEACHNNLVAQVKGFGEKTQTNILAEISFVLGNAKKLRYDKAEKIVHILIDELQKANLCSQIEVVGEYRRALEVVETLQFVLAMADMTSIETLRNYINTIAEISEIPQNSGVFVWRGVILPKQTPLEFHFVSTDTFVTKTFLFSAAQTHLTTTLANGKNLLQIAQSKNFATEEEIYQAANLQYVPVEMREGLGEIAKAQKNNLPNLLIYKDLQGAIHNHSTYSDGKNTLEEMLLACKAMNLQYFGISDHSQTAVYANGLSPIRIQEQHAEIDELNRKYAPFKILKGIESDILGDGSLDYSEEVLKTFDYVVASVHSNLKMDKETATQRLLTAIENPYTTILGHPTGRLLLKREGYPLDYQAIIEACAKNKVVIEINASPHRLDLDWRWIQYALECGVLLSINPDAHNTESLAYMHYGVLMGRKGGLSKQKTLNCMRLEEIEQFLAERKAKIQ
jgi:DNA polymerase (family 10)